MRDCRLEKIQVEGEFRETGYKIQREGNEMTEYKTPGLQTPGGI
jgi:hypothetical protein